MFREELAGTYWYCVNKNGSTWLLQSEKKPEFNDIGGYRYLDSPVMGWLMLNREGHLADDRAVRKDKVEVFSKDFENVSFPDRTYEDGPLEIEITKSGKLYWYGD